MKITKISALILCAMMLLAFTACGGKDKKNSDSEMTDESTASSDTVTDDSDTAGTQADGSETVSDETGNGETGTRNPDDSEKVTETEKATETDRKVSDGDLEPVTLSPEEGGSSSGGKKGLETSKTGADTEDGYGGLYMPEIGI